MELRVEGARLLVLEFPGSMADLVVVLVTLSFKPESRTST